MTPMKKFFIVFGLLFLAVWCFSALAETTPRSSTTTSRFRAKVACPSTHKFIGACPGWVMDHMKPLRCGGLDVPENLWWQTIAEARYKDVVEAECWRFYGS